MKAAIIGGGAAGFFAAIQCARLNPAAEVTLYEKGSKVLTKVLVSGGGRCNVTHAAYNPKELIKNYPRGSKELLGPFNKFQPKDTIAWFKAEGVELKTEDDGRLFPTTNKSTTISNALTEAAKNAGVKLRTQLVITSISKPTPDRFRLAFSSEEPLEVDCVLLATGSAADGYNWARALGHSITPPVPSLFTFEIKDPRLNGLAGVSVEKARVHLIDTDFVQTGPVLITHWGLSGPAILKLSSWGARVFHERNYSTRIEINWVNESLDKTLDQLRVFKNQNPKKQALQNHPFNLPKRLWGKIFSHPQPALPERWADFSNIQLKELAALLSNGVFQVTGKSTFKEEFVTCGGVDLREVDFRTMESRKTTGLYFAGEILDVDAVTGGFNFQNAWTTAWTAANAMGSGHNTKR